MRFQSMIGWALAMSSLALSQLEIVQGVGHIQIIEVEFEPHGLVALGDLRQIELDPLRALVGMNGPGLLRLGSPRTMTVAERQEDGDRGDRGGSAHLEAQRAVRSQ